jgi:hypothetical protein
MANRFTTYVLKNSDIVNRPLPSGLLKGEPIVNTAEGIMYFSGVTTSTPEWVTGSTAGVFEVGSNLYNLKIRNQITSYSGVTNLAGKFLSGTTSGFVLADVTSIQGVDSYVTGGTFSNNTLTLRLNEGKPNVPVTGFTDYYTTGATLIGSVAYFKRNDDLSGYTLDLSSFSPSSDTYVTGFTYTSATNTIYLRQNLGQAEKSIYIDSLSGLSLTNLTSGRVVYVGSGGALTDEAGFTYDAGTNTLSVPSDGAVSVGTGGLNVAGSAVIQGDLTVFGSAISAFTSQLYVEDPNITLNYNPTGNTTATSLGAGWTIQDGNGVNGGNVNLDIRSMDTLTGLTASQVPSITEYTASTGYANRGFVTQLNDIVIRSTNITTPNGVRVLAEFDILDGGTY